MQKLRQIVPQDYCLRCDVCCRFPEATSSQRPYSELTGRHLTLKPHQDYYICPNFNPETNRCTIYKLRPFDCRLYPFTLTYDSTNESAVLGMDTKCPFIMENQSSPALEDYKRYIIRYIQSKGCKNFISRNPWIIGPFQTDLIMLCTISINPVHIKAKYYGLKKITLRDKPLFDKFFKDIDCGLSIYSFVNIFIWKDIFNIYYKVINNNLCIFYSQSNSFFMIAPPVGDRSTLKKTISICFDIMDDVNMEMPSSRIENIDANDLSIFKEMGFKSYKKYPEYIYKTSGLVLLNGTRFKDKRNLINYFSKNYKYKFIPFNSRFKKDCLNLYLRWDDKKTKKTNDPIELSMLQDNLSVHKNIFDNYKRLGIIGRIVLVDNKVCGYTFGVKLNKDTFCILAEITDPSIKGLPQFIFRQFALEIKEPFINAMDDSGIENLRLTKLSYHPTKLLTPEIGVRTP